MFFIGILGIDNKSKEIKKLDYLNCSNCEQREYMKLIKNYNYFHIFFIPIIKWKEEYYIQCSGCNSIYKISDEKGKEIEKGVNLTLSYWDLDEINTNQNICKNCGYVLDNNFTYCPYCGERR